MTVKVNVISNFVTAFSNFFKIHTINILNYGKLRKLMVKLFLVL